MGWIGRLRGRVSGDGGPRQPETGVPAPRPPAPRPFADVDVPDLAAPLHARALVLSREPGSAIVEVQPPGRDPFRTTLRGGAAADTFSGLVIRWHVPVLFDGASADDDGTDHESTSVVLLEPPCGPDLPLVPEALQAARDARDLRTAALTRAYPPPSAAQLADLLAPTARATHPSFDAVCLRLGLLTTAEAAAVLDAIRTDGNAWDRAETDLYGWGPALPDDVRSTIGSFLAHLGFVAPHGRTLDTQPFWTVGVAALMRDLHHAQVDDAVFERVMRPFVQVCGPLPPGLTA